MSKNDNQGPDNGFHGARNQSKINGNKERKSYVVDLFFQTNFINEICSKPNVQLELLF